MTDPAKENSLPPRKKTSFNKGPLLLGVLLLVFVVFSHLSSVSAIYCDENKHTDELADIVMLSASWCPYCKQARRYFEKNELDYCEFDIERSIKGKQLYDSVNGQGVPLILIGNDKLRGFSEHSVNKALDRLHNS